MTAVDLASGTVRWQAALGTTREMALFRCGSEGVPIGGPITTATGVLFIAATTDNYVNAFDTETGKVWSAHAVRATPRRSHRLKKNGSSTW